MPGSLDQGIVAKSLRGKDINLLSKKSKSNVEYIQRPLQWVPGGPFTGIR
jgi:hypothetical protein